MNDFASLSVIRLRIPCASEHEFQERYAERYTVSGVFVPSDNLRPVGTHVRLVVELKGSPAKLSGEAIVCAHTQVAGRDGMRLRLLGLDPESIPLHAAPSVPAPPIPAPPIPAPPVAAPAQPGIRAPFPRPPPLRPAPIVDLASALFDEEDVDGEAAAARPLEVRTQPIALRVKESTVSPEPAKVDPDDVEAIRADEGPRSLEPEQTMPDGADGKTGWLRRAPGRLVAAAAVVVLGAALLVGWLVVRQRRAPVTNALDAEIQTADTRILEGWLAGKQGDAAVDHLLAAKQLSPRDSRVQGRIQMLTDKLEELGILALSRENLDEAAVHFEAAVRVDPLRKSVAQRLAEVRQRKALPEVAAPAP